MDSQLLQIFLALLTIFSTLMSTLFALASFVYRNERRRRVKAEKLNDAMEKIIMMQAAKKDEHVAELVRLLENRGSD